MIKYTQMFLLKDSFLIRMERLNLKFYCNIRAIHKLTFVIIFYQVNSELTGDVSGLCGNMNGHREDDWTMKTGVMAGSTADLFSSWSITSHSCPSQTCPQQMQNNALRLCKTVRFSLYKLD